MNMINHLATAFQRTSNGLLMRSFQRFQRPSDGLPAAFQRPFQRLPTGFQRFQRPSNVPPYNPPAGRGPAWKGRPPSNGLPTSAGVGRGFDPGQAIFLQPRGTSRAFSGVDFSGQTIFLDRSWSPTAFRPSPGSEGVGGLILQSVLTRNRCPGTSAFPQNSKTFFRL
jgi:hypothetical protein